MGYGRCAMALMVGVTALAGPAQAGAADVIQDGSFEAATDGNASPFWAETDSHAFGGPRYNCDIASFPRTGMRCAEFSGTPSGTRTAGAEQAVTLATGSAILTFYVRRSPSMTVNPNDRVRARIDGTVVSEIAPTSLSTSYGQFNADVSAFADGGQHVLRIEGLVHSDSNVSYAVDDVSLDSVPAPPPRPKNKRDLTLDSSKNTVKKGKSVTLSGQVTEIGRQACQSGQTVSLQRKRPSQTTFTTVEQVQTDAGGSFSAKQKVKKTYEYRAEVAETDACLGQTSNTEKVKAKKK